MNISNPCFHCHNYCDETNCHIRHYSWCGNNEAEEIDVLEEDAFHVLGLINFEHLSAELFTFELYEPGFWDALGLGYAESMDFYRLISRIKEYGIGWCDGTRLSVRPRNNTIAVMCEVDGEKFWFHLDKASFVNL